MRQIKFIAIKEFYHVLRDARSLAIALAMPVMMTFLYGFAISLDIEDISLAVIDYDQSAESRDLTDRFYASTYFSRAESEVDPVDPERIFRRGQANAVLLIKPGFADALGNGSEFEIGLLIDGADNNVASAVQGYAGQLINLYLLDHFYPDKEPPGIRIASQVLYNPDLESSHFFVPGLVAIVLLMISALLTSITIAREKETGTMEQLLTAPVTAIEILVGKIIPYVGIALLDGVLVLIFAKLVFDVPFVGSHLLLLGFGLVYVTTSLSIGILISSLVKTQQVAMMAAIVATMLPSVMLSGFIFNLDNMPWVLQAISRIIPATYFLTIIRGIMLKGAGLGTLIWQGGYLLLLMTVMIAIASLKFSRRVA